MQCLHGVYINFLSLFSPSYTTQLPAMSIPTGGLPVTESINNYTYRLPKLDYTCSHLA